MDLCLYRVARAREQGITLEMDVGSLLASDSCVGRLYFGTSPTFAREISLNGQTNTTPRNTDSAPILWYGPLHQSTTFVPYRKCRKMSDVRNLRSHGSAKRRGKRKKVHLSRKNDVNGDFRVRRGGV
ncbi:hypothetical protein ANTQUA_LOCUS4148 [Anthophora quadrimaculata]